MKEPLLVRLTTSVTLLGLVAFMPVLMVLVVLVYLLDAQYREAKEIELLGVARAFLVAVEEELASTGRLAEGLAASDSLARGDLPRFDFDARQMVRAHPEIHAIVVTDLAAGIDSINTERAPGQFGPSSAIDIEQGLEVARLGKSRVFNLRATPTSRYPLIPILAPVPGVGQVTKAVNILLSPEYMSRIFRKSGYDPAWTGAFVDPDLIVAGRNRAPEQFVGKRVTAGVQEAMRAGREGMFRSITQEGQPVYSLFVRSPDTGWGVALSLPTEEIDAPISRVKNLMLGTGFLAGGAGLGFAAFFGQRVQRARRAERELSQSLERLVAERTSELRESEDQLRQAQKMEAVGQLTSGVAHDFNNLLGVIVGNLDFIEPALADHPAQRKHLDEAVAAVERGASLTRQLLAFSRRQMLSPRRLDIGVLVMGMVGLLQRTLTASVELKVDIDQDLPPCYADPAQVENAILNLAINARDAMPQGGKLSIAACEFVVRAEDGPAAAAEVSPGRYLMISVSDTGMGMTPEVLERAAEPFFTTKDVGKGSGLGLSMVYGVARQSGGFFWLESTAGRGTTVRIFLPIDASLDQTATPPRDRVAPRGRGEIVLTVEDNAALRKTTVAAMIDLGYVPIEAADGGEALAVIARHPRIDMLMTDIVLPGGKDGFELAEEVRRLRPGLRVLFTSGYAAAERLDMLSKFKGSRFLQKPYRAAQLSKELAATLRLKSG